MTESERAERLKRIQRVLDECLRRRAAGEALPDETVIHAHRDLLPELRERLTSLRLIEQAGRRADDSAPELSPTATLEPETADLSDLTEDATIAHVGASLLDALGRRMVAEPGEELTDLARYEILEPLGKGGMGIVVKARDRRLGRIVALKRIGRHLSGSGRDQERFLAEARAVAALNHYNIVQIYDVDQDADGYFISMEYVEGEDLRTKIARDGKLDPERAVELARQVCNALSYAHERGIIHRDIKPGNILISARGTPKLVDFGLARIAEGQDLTQTGAIMGTTSYASPEQLRDSKNVDHRTDIYSLGATLYEMLTGLSPRVIQDSKLPEALRAYVLKAVEHDREQRFSTADALAEALAEAKVGDADHLVRRADHCYRDGDLEGALERYERVIRLDPDHIHARERIGAIQSKIAGIRRDRRQANDAAGQSQWETAVAAWQRVLQSAPGDTEARQQLAKAEAEIRNAKLAAALDQARRGLNGGAWLAADEQCRAALELDPSNPEAAGIRRAVRVARVHAARDRLRTGLRAFQDKDYAGAIDLLREALELVPEDHAERAKVVQSLDLAEALAAIAEADRAIAQGEMPAAAQLLDEVQAKAGKYENLLDRIQKRRAKIAQKQLAAQTLARRRRLYRTAGIVGGAVCVIAMVAVAAVWLRPVKPAAVPAVPVPQTQPASVGTPPAPTAGAAPGAGAPVARPTKTTGPTKLATLPAGLAGSPCRWLGYAVRQDDPSLVPAIAAYTNFMFVWGFPDTGPQLVEAARAAGLPVVLGFSSSQRDGIEKRLTPLLQQYRDVIAAVCWSHAYIDGYPPQAVAEFGDWLKGAFPGVQYWCAFVERPRGQPETQPVPAVVDVLVVTVWSDHTPKMVRAKCDKNLPDWLAKASGRPVLLSWMSWTDTPPGLVPGCTPGTLRTCAEMAQQYGLAGLMFYAYGDRTGLRGIETNPALVAEVQDIARQWGFARQELQEKTTVTRGEEPAGQRGTLQRAAPPPTVKVDGQPFFVIGARQAEPADFAELAAAGFNTVSYAYREAARQYLDAAQHEGLHAVVYAGRPLGQSCDWQACERDVRDLRDHPALLAWGLPVCPVWTKRDLGEMQVAAATLRRADDVHPRWLLETPVLENWQRFVPFAGLGDIIAIEPHPYWSDGFCAKGLNLRDPILAVPHWTEEARALGAGKPTWVLLQGHIGNGMRPTRAQFRATAYLAVNHGAGAVEVDGYKRRLWEEDGMPNTPGLGDPLLIDLRQEAARVAGELKQLAPAILAGPVLDAVTIEGEGGNVDLRCFAQGDRLYAIAVNASGQNLSPTLVVRPTLKPAVQLLGESRTLSCAGGRLGDSFAPYDTHVYIMDLAGDGPTRAAPPPPVPPTDVVRKEPPRPPATPREPAASNVRYVNPRAKGQGSGASWANAYTKLQDALAAANAGDEIWVVAGTYKPAGPGGDRSATFQLKSGVGVYGGFAGREKQRDERDPNKNVTILSGDLNGDDGPDFAKNAENSFHVVTGSNVDQTAILDGFTVTAGNADGPAPKDSAGDDDGGALFCLAGNPTLANCTFRANSAADSGAGLYTRRAGGLTLTKCTFIGNRAKWGGGFLTAQGTLTTLVSCTFAGNVSTFVGGGGLRSVGGDLSLVNCTFSGNSAAQEGGGLCNPYAGRAMLVNCTFVGNSAPEGRALVCGAGRNPGQAQPNRRGLLVLTNCILWDGGEEIANQGGVVKATFSDIQGGWEGKGNLSVDPLFVDPDGPDKKPGTADDNLRLRAGSPCIDKGNSGAVPPDSAALDLDGKLRVSGNAVDMGAYEFQAGAADSNRAAPDVAQKGAAGAPSRRATNDFQALFNGKDLTGWTCSEGSWAVEAGALRCKGGGYLWTEQAYGDFILEFECRFGPGGNSGVFLRTADIADPVQTGMELQLLDDFGKPADKRGSGAIYDCITPHKNAIKEAGEWNRVRVTCRGRKLEIVLNGEPVVDMNLDQWTVAGKNPDGSPNRFKTAYKNMPRTGYIGLQEGGTPVWFRNIRLKSLDAAGTPGGTAPPGDSRAAVESPN